MTIPLAGDPFASFRSSFADLMMAVLGLMAMVSLAVAVVNVMKGEKEAAGKMLRWLMAIVAGIVVIAAIKAV